MKKPIIALMLLFFAAGCGHVATNNPVAANEQAPANTHVDTGKYEKIFSSEVILIDVRTPMEFRYDHLEKAVNIPFDKIKEDIKYFAPNKAQAIAVYCASGGRTKMALKELAALGYKNVIDAGKFKKLKEMEAKMNKANTD